jgi:two-component system CheB/CheR fusion protein
MRWHLSRAVPVRDESGQVVRWFGTNTDITDLIEMEAALKEADRRKDEFLALLAHELRNPLAPVRNAVQIMKLLGPVAPPLQQAREMIDRQVEHLTRLVDDLLDVSRITRGKITLRKEPAELSAILTRAVETSRPLIEANRHTLTVSIPPDSIRVIADPTRLEQVFANLLNNAAKYTERGGSVALIVERHGDVVAVRVRDTGFGIPAEVLPHVFDLFMQADRTLDRAQGGLGIGLTLVKALVEMHGGTVTAHSAGLGKGSEFVVQLPVVKDKGQGTKGEAESPTPGPSPFGLRPSRRVLVVDDNRDAAESLGMLLRLWGHEVRTAHDGRSGLKAALSYRPQVVLLDIGLPGLDGYEVARRLREEFGGAALLVAMTGYGREEDRRRAEEVGFDAHLTKPADPAALRSLLAGWTPPAVDRAD